MRDWLARRRFELVVCPLLVKEIVKVASRPHLQSRLRLDTMNAYLRDVAVGATQRPDPDAIAQTTRDRQDDYLVALAREARADVIVTGDRDLLEWEEQSPPAVTPTMFEQMLSDDVR